MLSELDLKQIAQKGITPEQIENQLQEFKTGFPFLRLEGPAAIGNGIVAPTEAECQDYVKTWNDYKAEGKKIVKFVPASGAASRMFKNMFAFLDADYECLQPTSRRSTSTTSRSLPSMVLWTRYARRMRARE